MSRAKEILERIDSTREVYIGDDPQEGFINERMFLDFDFEAFRKLLDKELGGVLARKVSELAFDTSTTSRYGGSELHMINRDKLTKALSREFSKDFMRSQAPKVFSLLNTNANRLVKTIK